jgi:hypothetical protein
VLIFGPMGLVSQLLTLRHAPAFGSVKSSAFLRQ